jgi:hypothetical protein
VEAGVAEAGDDEGGGVGKGLGEGQQMRDREVGLGLAFDAGRALGQGQAGDVDAKAVAPWGAAGRWPRRCRR